MNVVRDRRLRSRFERLQEFQAVDLRISLPSADYDTKVINKADEGLQPDKGQWPSIGQINARLRNVCYIRPLFQCRTRLKMGMLLLAA